MYWNEKWQTILGPITIQFVEALEQNDDFQFWFWNHKTCFCGLYEKLWCQAGEPCWGFLQFGILQIYNLTLLMTARVLQTDEDLCKNSSKKSAKHSQGSISWNGRARPITCNRWHVWRVCKREYTRKLQTKRRKKIWDRTKAVGPQVRWSSNHNLDLFSLPSCSISILWKRTVRESAPPEGIRIRRKCRVHLGAP